MSNLHFYEDHNMVAYGQGTLNPKGFSVKVTYGVLKADFAYVVKRGMKTSGSMYPCVKGAERGGVAIFSAKLKRVRAVGKL